MKSFQGNEIPENDAEKEEEGEHDTITSLPGRKLLHRYRKAIATKGPDRESAATDSKRVDDDDGFVPPDGGYGWIVALGAFVALFWCSGMIRSYGVVFGAMLKTFPDSSKSLASWIPASMTSFALAVAPLAGALCQRWDCRRVTMAGAAFCSMGIGLSSLATNMETLFVSLGVLTGVGVGLSTTPGIILTAGYFDRNRAKANAFCLSGSAAGGFFLPHLIQALMEEYGFRGAVLVLGACMLHICVSAAMFRPLQVHARINRICSKRKNNSKSCYCPTETLLMQKLDSSLVEVEEVVRDAAASESVSSSSSSNHKEWNSLLTLLGYCDMLKEIIYRSNTSVVRLTPNTNEQQCDSKDKCLSRVSAASLLVDTCTGTDSPIVIIPQSTTMHQVGSTRTLFKSSVSVATSEATTKRNEEKASSLSSLMYSLEDLCTASTSTLTLATVASSGTSKSGLSVRRRQMLDRSISERCPEHSRCALSRSSSDRCPNHLIELAVPEAPLVEVPIESHDVNEAQQQPSCFSRYLDLSVVREPDFILITLTVMLMTVGSPHVLFFLPAHAETVGMAASTLLSISAVFDLLGRLSAGVLIDMKLLPIDAFYAIAIVIAAISVLLIPICGGGGASLLVATVGLYGLGTGAWVVMVPLSLSERFGVHRISSSYGMTRFFQSGANLFGPILGGYFWERTGGLSATFYFFGSAMSLAAAVAISLHWLDKKEKGPNDDDTKVEQVLLSAEPTD